jgi:hypothetical protein
MTDPCISEGTNCQVVCPPGYYIPGGWDVDSQGDITRDHNAGECCPSPCEKYYLCDFSSKDTQTPVSCPHPHGGWAGGMVYCTHYKLVGCCKPISPPPPGCTTTPPPTTPPPPPPNTCNNGGSDGGGEK